MEANFADITDTVVLRCETQKSKKDFVGEKCNPHDMLLSIATTYSYKTDTYKIWQFTKQNELCKYLHGKKVVVFNGVKFDFPLLFGDLYKPDPTYLFRDNGYCIYIIDILYQIFQSIYRVNTYNQVIEKLNKNPISDLKAYSMYSIYSATLNKQKVQFDAAEIELFKTKRIIELIEVNLFKLNMLKQLYEFIQKHGYCINGNYDVVKLQLQKHNSTDVDDFLPF